MSVTIHHDKAENIVSILPAESVQCVVTSPPYYGLRDYGVDGQIGLEKTPEEYVGKLVQVFRGVRDVLRPDGTVWLNLGNSYNIGIPWRVAFALQADGWYLRSDIIWHKPNPMPESVTDRPTKAHEYLFLLSKSARYYYDADAVKEPSVTRDPRRPYTSEGAKQLDGRKLWHSGKRRDGDDFSYRNRRSVWTIPVRPFPEAHFATFPERLPELCILAGSKPGDLVLDPFVGSGTTLLVAERLGRRAVGTEINGDYIEIAKRRLSKVQLSMDLEGAS